MATITQAQWKQYIARLRKINDTAAEEFKKAVMDRGGYENIDRQKLIDYAYGISTKYGEASAALSAEMYDVIAELSGVIVPEALPAETATYSEVAKTVNGIIKNVGNEDTLAQGIGRLVKMAGTDTVLSNAYRDRPKGKGSKKRHSGAQVAWIPVGDTCPFCLMLASKGWQNQTQWAANSHSEHIHANCDCTYAVRFNNDLKIDGYNPEEYKEIYDNAEGSTRKEKLNSIRRMQYQDPEIRNKINAQKRAAYALRNGKEIVGTDDNLVSIIIDSAFSEKSREKVKAIANRLANDYNSPLKEIVKTSKTSGQGGGEKGYVGIGRRDQIHLASTSPETIIHEFAHTLAIEKEDKLGLSDNSEFWKEIKKIRREYNEAVAKDTSKRINAYAGTNLEEFFAEAFTQAKAHEIGEKLSWDYGDDLTYSKKVLEVVNKYFGRKSVQNKELLKLAKDGNTYVLKLDDLYKNSEKIKPLKDYTDIVVHGDPYGVAFRDYNGKEENINIEEFVNIIKEGGSYKGGKIRLISCNTGEPPAIVPQYLADTFNVEVLAPNEAVFVFKDGKMVVTNDEENAIMNIETGKWVPFYPKK